MIIGSSGDNFTPIGVLVTGGGAFTSFTCAGGLLSMTVTGNVIGQPNNPFTSHRWDSVQKYKLVTTMGITWNLISDIAGGSFASSQEGKGKVTLSGAVTPTCS